MPVPRSSRKRLRAAAGRVLLRHVVDAPAPADTDD